MRGPGFCLQNAIRELTGINARVPEWIMSDDIPTICAQYGLRMLRNRGRVKDSDGIVVYDAGDNEGHAEYIRSLREIDWSQSVIAVIVK